MAEPVGITGKVGVEPPFSNDVPNSHSACLLLFGERAVDPVFKAVAAHGIFGVASSIVAYAGLGARQGPELHAGREVLESQQAITPWRSRPPDARAASCRSRRTCTATP